MENKVKEVIEKAKKMWVSQSQNPEWDEMITNVDTDPDKFYEVFVYNSENGSETIAQCDTFEEAMVEYGNIVSDTPTAFSEFIADEVGVDVWCFDKRTNSNEFLFKLI